MALYAAKVMGARTYARRGEVAALIAAIREEEQAALQRLKEEWILKEQAERQAARMFTKRGSAAANVPAPRRPDLWRSALRPER